MNLLLALNLFYDIVYNKKIIMQIYKIVFIDKFYNNKIKSMIMHEKQRRTKEWTITSSEI